jgi:hypothetical protein
VNRQVWIHRASAFAALVLAGIALTALAAAAGDVITVNRAQADLPAQISSASNGGASRWQPLKPLLRRNGAPAKTAIGEYLNGTLGEVGLNISSVETLTVRALGGGLLLAEVQVEARGDATASATAANWVAVNREAVRLKSLVVELGPDGSGTSTMVLLMVIA